MGVMATLSLGSHFVAKKTRITLKEVREAAQLSQKELHDLSGVRIMTISSYENNPTRVTLETLDKLAAALGVSTLDLIEEVDTDD